MQVTELYKIPNFIVDVTSDTLFTRWNFKHVFTLTLTPGKIAPFILDTMSPLIQNYTILSSSDIGSSTLSNGKSIIITNFITLILTSSQP